MRKHPAGHGFTLAEVIVSMAILAALSLALVIIYKSGLKEAENTSGRVSMQIQARLLLDRLAPLVSTAVRETGSDTSDPIFFPSKDPAPLGQLNTPVPRLEWRSSANLFNDYSVAKDPTEPVAPGDFRVVEQRRYEIIHEADAAANGGPAYGPIGAADYSVRLREMNYTTGAALANPPAQVLANNIQELQFTRIEASAVRVRIVVSNQVGGRYHRGELMRRWDNSADSTGTEGGAKRIYTLESALLLPVFTGI